MLLCSICGLRTVTSGISSSPPPNSTMMTEEMFAQIMAKLEEMNELLRSPAEQPTPSSAPSTSLLTANTEEREAGASTISTPATTSSASFITSPSTKPATSPSTSPTPSPTSALRQDADLDFLMGVTELLATSPTRCSTRAPCQYFTFMFPTTNLLAVPSASPALSLTSAPVVADNWGGLFDEVSVPNATSTGDGNLPVVPLEVTTRHGSQSPRHDSELSGIVGKAAATVESTVEREKEQTEARPVSLMVPFEQDAVRILDRLVGDLSAPCPPRLRQQRHGLLPPPRLYRAWRVRRLRQLQSAPLRPLPRRRPRRSSPRPPWLRRPRRAPPRPPQLRHPRRAPPRRRGRPPRLRIRGRRPRLRVRALLPQPGAVHHRVRAPPHQRLWGARGALHAVHRQPPRRVRGRRHLAVPNLLPLQDAAMTSPIPSPPRDAFWINLAASLSNNVSTAASLRDSRLASMELAVYDESSIQLQHSCLPLAVLPILPTPWPSFGCRAMLQLGGNSPVHGSNSTRPDDRAGTIIVGFLQNNSSSQFPVFCLMEVYIAISLDEVFWQTCLSFRHSQFALGFASLNSPRRHMLVRGKCWSLPRTQGWGDNNSLWLELGIVQLLCISPEGPYSSILDACEVFRLRHYCISDNYLLNISCIKYRKGNKMPKPPWLLRTEEFHSWAGRLHLCKDFIMSESKQSKILLELIFGIYYVELPFAHSNFQSYILVYEVLPGKPVALHFICTNDGKFLLQPWLSQPVIVNAEHHQLKLKSQRKIDGQLVQIRYWKLKLEQEDNKLNIFLHGTGVYFHASSNTNALKLILQHLKFPWPPPNYKTMLLLLCVNCLLSQPVMEMYCHWKFLEPVQHWGAYELPILMGDMSYSASEITVLNPHEVVNVNKNSSPKFGLSKLALLLLFGKHSETSSCQVSVEYILQGPHPTQDECKHAGNDNWLVHLLSTERSNRTGLLVPQPWPPPCVIRCWMLCRILDQCKCLEITHIRKEAITQNSEQQGVSDWPVSVLIYDDPLRGLVLAWEVTRIMGRCGLIADAPHWRGSKTTYAKGNIATESQFTPLLQGLGSQDEAITVAASFDSELHRMTWDPGDSLFTESAWGQAEILGGGNVTDLGPLGCQSARDVGWVVLSPWKQAKTHTNMATPPAGRLVEGPRTYLGRDGGLRLEASFARFYPFLFSSSFNPPVHVPRTF